MVVKITSESQLHKIAAGDCSEDRRATERRTGLLDTSGASSALVQQGMRQWDKPGEHYRERRPLQRPANSGARQGGRGVRSTTFSRCSVECRPSQWPICIKAMPFLIVATEGTRGGSHRHHTLKRSGTDSSGCSQWQPGHDAYALEFGRRSWRRRDAVVIRNAAIIHIVVLVCINGRHNEASEIPVSISCFLSADIYESPHKRPRCVWSAPRTSHGSIWRRHFRGR